VRKRTSLGTIQKGSIMAVPALNLQFDYTKYGFRDTEPAWNGWRNTCLRGGSYQGTLAVKEGALDEQIHRHNSGGGFHEQGIIWRDRSGFA
jgi:hypothetical protein